MCAARERRGRSAAPARKSTRKALARLAAAAGVRGPFAVWIGPQFATAAARHAQPLPAAAAAATGVAMRAVTTRCAELALPAGDAARRALARLPHVACACADAAAGGQPAACLRVALTRPPPGAARSWAVAADSDEARREARRVGNVPLLVHARSGVVAVEDPRRWPAFRRCAKAYGCAAYATERAAYASVAARRLPTAAEAAAKATAAAPADVAVATAAATAATAAAPPEPSDLAVAAVAAADTPEPPAEPRPPAQRKRKREPTPPPPHLPVSGPHIESLRDVERLGDALRKRRRAHVAESARGAARIPKKRGRRAGARGARRRKRLIRKGVQ